jgi:hypothetical protein
VWNYHNALDVFLPVVEDKADVDRIAVADRDACLQIFEKGMPGAAERVGSNAEVAEILHHDQSNSL